MTIPGIENDPYFTGNQGHFHKFYPLFCRKSRKTYPKIFSYSYDFEETFSFFPLLQGIEHIFFSEKKYPYFYHFKDAFEFYPHFTGK